jgi:hypothetical protein
MAHLMKLSKDNERELKRIQRIIYQQRHKGKEPAKNNPETMRELTGYRLEALETLIWERINHALEKEIVETEIRKENK